MKFILWSLTEKIGDKLLRKTSIRRTRKQSPSAPFPPQPPPPPSPHTVRASVTSFAASTATLSLADSPVMVSITSNTTPRPAVDDREIRSRRQVHADHGVENSALCQHPLLRYIPTEHTSDAADQDPYIHNYRVYLTTCITTIQEALRERELLRQSYIRAVADESDGTEVPHYQTPDHVEKEVYMLRDHAVAKGWGVPLQKSAPNIEYSGVSWPDGQCSVSSIPSPDTIPQTLAENHRHTNEESDTETSPPDLQRTSMTWRTTKPATG